MSRGYKWIDKNIYKSGDTYFIRLMHNGIRWREPAGRRLTDARKLLVKRQAEIVEGRLGISQEHNVTFEEAAEQYLEHCRHNMKGFNKPAYTIRYAMELLKGKRLKDITSWDIEKYKNMRLGTTLKNGKRISGTTVPKELQHLNRLFVLAEQWGMLPPGYNPVRLVKKPKENRGRVPELSLEDEKRLLEACTPSIRPIVKFAIYTGCRRREILELSWDRVDLERGFIYLEETKTDEPRYVPLCKPAREVLEAIKHREGHVFLNENGKPYTCIRASFNRAKRKAGLDNLVLHDMRHVFASRLRRRGVSLGDISEAIGNKTHKMALRYAHLSPEYLKGVVDVLNRDDENLATFWPPQPNPEEPNSSKSLKNNGGRCRT